MTDAPGFAGVERRWGPGVVSVVVAEEAALLRRRVVLALEEHPRIEVVAEVVDLDSLLGALEAYRPTVAVLDVRLPPDGAGRAVEILGVAHPAVGLVLVTDAESTAADADRSGVALVPRADLATHVASAVVAVADGGGPSPDPADRPVRGEVPTTPGHR